MRFLLFCLFAKVYKMSSDVPSLLERYSNPQRNRFRLTLPVGQFG